MRTGELKHTSIQSVVLHASGKDCILVASFSSSQGPKGVVFLVWLVQHMAMQPYLGTRTA